MRIVSVLAATGAGAAVGWVCSVIPMWPVARLVAAAVSGWFVGCVGVVVFALFPSRSGGLGAVSFGLSEAVLLGVPAVFLLAVVSHLILRRLEWSPTIFTTYGPVVVGGGAALIAALWLARGMTISGNI